MRLKQINRSEWVGMRLLTEQGLPFASLEIDGHLTESCGTYALWQAFDEQGHRVAEVVMASSDRPGVLDAALLYPFDAPTDPVEWRIERAGDAVRAALVVPLIVPNSDRTYQVLLVVWFTHAMDQENGHAYRAIRSIDGEMEEGYLTR